MALMRASLAAERDSSVPAAAGRVARILAMRASYSALELVERLLDRERIGADGTTTALSAERRRRERTEADQDSEVLLGVRRIELASLTGAEVAAGEAGREALRGVVGVASSTEDLRVMPRTARAPARSVGREPVAGEAGCCAVAGEVKSGEAETTEGEVERASKSWMRS